MNSHKTPTKIVVTGGSGFLGSHLLKNKAFKEALVIGRTKPYNYLNFKKVCFISNTNLTEILNDTDKIDILMEDGSTIPFSISELLIGNIKEKEFIAIGIAMYDLGIFKYAISIYDIAIDQGLKFLSFGDAVLFKYK